MWAGTSGRCDTSSRGLAHQKLRNPKIMRLVRRPFDSSPGKRRADDFQALASATNTTQGAALVCKPPNG